MEFPTALLGVALGVVLMPQLAAARAANDSARYSAMLDWGLRLVVLLALPCAVALLTFSRPLVAVLYHYGAFSVTDVQQTTLALMGYGVGLLGLVAIKVLAPGFYASQDIRTPVKIAVVVLVITQLLNMLLVPWLAHAGLALSIGLGAMVNAAWLLWGLLSRGSYRPQPGWGRFALKVLLATALVTAWLGWAAHALPWVSLRDEARAIVHILNSRISGPVNIVAPAEATSRTVMRSLASAMKRPFWLPAPGWAIRLLLGRAGNELLLASQRVHPTVLEADGFVFTSATVDAAIAEALA
jgi:putative peptidoglycan lipid II flippase